MKILFAIAMTLSLMTASGCQGTNVSSQGGIVPIDEEFSITVPTPNTIKQGGNATVTVVLNRGAYFKRDVQLDTKTDGITITPSSVLVKASDVPNVLFQVNVARDAAIGEYRVNVTGTPTTGTPTATVFIVNVVAQ
ncbi:MAG TPA: hypothetical protein VK737_10225 [Opitutales bacterium]|jgi:hypothetical protein|nr:hypothetical protein [Opitutales bacterium]